MAVINIGTGANFNSWRNDFNLICTKVGDVSVALETTAQDIVGAINELDGQNPPDASTTTKGLIEIATLAEVVTGASATLAVVPSTLKNHLASPNPIGLTTPNTIKTTQLNADNIRIDGNVISSQDTNGAITLTPNGSGVVSVSSNITMGASKTVDGRDISVDGTKLDTIATGAQVNPTNAATKTAYEANANTNAFTDAEQTKVSNMPYDIAFNAGYDNLLIKENIEVGTFGEMIVGRAVTITSATGFLDTVATGATVFVDILKNGSTIYSVKPSFAVSTSTLSSGTLSTTTLAVGDRITFKVTQIGSTIPGQGLRFTLITKIT